MCKVQTQGIPEVYPLTLGKFVLILGFHHPLHFNNSGNIYLTDLPKEEVEETLQCPITVTVKKQYFCRKHYSLLTIVNYASLGLVQGNWKVWEAGCR